MMNIKALKEYNKSRRQYHNLLAEELGRQVVQHILHKARKIQKLYRLEANATEEVEQEISIAAFDARDKWTPEIDAKKSTFVLAAVNNHSAYLARKLSGLPIMENYETGTDMQAVGQFHKFSQENILKIYDQNNAMYAPPIPANNKEQVKQKRIHCKERPRIKPSLVSCGSELADHLAAKPVCDNPLKMDIDAFFAALPLRHQIIVLMLEDGYTQEEIAAVFGITQPRIVQITQAIQNKFSI